MANYFFNWTNDAPSIDRWFKDHGFIEIKDPLDIGDSIRLATGDLVFVHATNHSFWIEKAQENQGIDFVFMSRASGFKREDKWPDNIHICKYPADKLEQFDKVKRFFQELSSGNRLWDLLIPDSKNHLIALSILCQGYLAAHGGEGLGEEWKKLIETNSNLKQTVEAKKGDTLNKDEWWKKVLGEDDTQIQGELDSVQNSWKKKVQDLINGIYKKNGNMPSNGTLVADAYSALKSILQGK